MALKPSLRLISRKIAEAVQRSAAAQGLSPHEYALAGSFDEQTDRISLTLWTDHPIDDRLWYANTLQEIRRSFPDDPHITMHIGIVIRRVQSLEDAPWVSIGAEDEMDLTELLECS